MRIRSVGLFTLICLISILTLFIKQEFIESRIAAFEVMQDRGDMGQIHILNALTLFGIPFYYLWKFTITTFFLWVGCFMFGYRITFSSLFKITIMAEPVFLVADLSKVVWFFVSRGDPSYWDIKAFYPLSLINLVNYEDIGPQWHYVLKSLNLFEITYWLILVYFIHYKAEKRLNYAYAIVFSSYVLFYMAWMVFYVVTYK